LYDWVIERLYYAVLIKLIFNISCRFCNDLLTVSSYCTTLYCRHK